MTPLNLPKVLASGSSASPRRTVMGVLGQMEAFEVPQPIKIAILETAGLPARAFDEPDFPISMDQELVVLSELLSLLDGKVSLTMALIDIANGIGINHFGIAGLAMQHAPSLVEALRLPGRYPQLYWGHSRFVLSRTQETALVAYSLDQPKLLTAKKLHPRLSDYCISLDLLSARRMIDDITGNALAPLKICLPTNENLDAKQASAIAGCPVEFSASDALLVYPAELLDIEPLHASPLGYKSYEKMAREASRMLADNISIAERAARLLWAYSPPPSRIELARMLGMSTRSLARKLLSDNTSYNELLRDVQRERACNLLKNGDLRASEVAGRLGYADPAAFTRAFKDWTGKTPTEWQSLNG